MKLTSQRITALITVIIILNACALNPLSWTPNKAPQLKGVLKPNDKLSTSHMINLEGWYGPEDIIFDSLGNLYCGVHIGPKDFSDGRILKITPEGGIEVFYDANSWVSGLHFDNKNNLIALSHKEGLIQIAPNKEVTVLATTDENDNAFLIPNGLDIASDGIIYFSNTSQESSYTVKYGRKLILEMRAKGGLYKYDPKNNEVTTLIDGTYFGNGVALSKNESFLLMTETTKYRVIKYWLKGEKKGTHEVFIDNLPGFPNGISIRDDGSFWLGFTTRRNSALDKIHPKKGMKKFVYSMPEFLQPQQEKFGLILNISEHGKIISSLYDTTGLVVPEAGAVKEHEGKLYIGGDNVPEIAVYNLE